jgi:hypothetical protein
MINFKVLSRTALVLSCVLFTGLSCKQPIKPDPTPTKPINILQPAGGEHYIVGDTMHIIWQNNSANISSVKVFLCRDSTRIGLADTTIITNLTWLLSLGSISPPDSTLDWKIDSSYVSSHCTVLIREYFDNVEPDTSGVFSITLN